MVYNVSGFFKIINARPFFLEISLIFIFVFDRNIDTNNINMVNIYIYNLFYRQKCNKFQRHQCFIYYFYDLQNS